MTAKVLCTIGSVITIGFGVWHFFVPKIYNWYNYIDKSASELIIAVKAINVFFSLCLVLIGMVNIIFTYFIKDNLQGFFVMMIMSAILWLGRVVMQIVFRRAA